MLRFESEDLKRIKDGDNEPLKKVFTACFGECLQQLIQNGYCTRQDAEDVLMDSFMVLRDKIVDGSFNNENVQAYLVIVAKNRYRNKNKRDKRLVEFDPKVIEAQLEGDESDEISELDQSRIQLILKAINELSGSCKNLLTKNLVEGWPLKNLVEELDYSSYDVIKTSKARCMKKLRSIIDKAIENE